MNLPDHHAILIESDVEETLASIQRSTDTIFLSFENLGIDEVRSIIETSLTAPINEEKKRIIISFESITREAQNALLKIFEDPSPQVKFLIATENAHALLPTLRSRLHIIQNDRIKNVENNFLKLSITERIRRIEILVKNQKETGSKAEIRSFLLSLRYELTRTGEGSQTTLKALHRAIEYLDDKGSSVKILLESVALAL